MWNRHPGASIGIPTGERFFALDFDRLDALGELPGELPATWTVRTPSGGFHLYFQAAEGVTNSTGGLPQGIDVRGTGGYVIVPPSPGYEVVNRSPTAKAPRWLLEMIRGSSEGPGVSLSASPRLPRARRPEISGGPIPEGERNRALFFAALDVKDDGCDAGEVLERIQSANEHRCSPPLDTREVERISRSAMRYPVRSGKATPEMIEAVRELVAAWWDHLWKGLGGQSDRDVLRVLLELALRYGRLNEDGSVDISASVRSISLAASVSYQTVSGGCTRRLAEWVEKLPADRAEHSATWRLSAPSRPPNTNSTERGAALVFKTSDAPPTMPAETPCWRHRGLVGKGAGGVEALLELHGAMSRDEVAAALGWKNAREVERRYLRLLESRGLAEPREDGRYALVEGHAEAVEEIQAAPYAVLLCGERWEWDALSETWGWEPDVYGASRSEDERTEADAAAHVRQREEFRAELVRRELEREASDEDVAFEELIPATSTMLSANRTGRYLLARGWQRLSRREWAHPETGELLTIDRAMHEAVA